MAPRICIGIALTVLAMAGAAQAHVTVHPNKLPADSFVVAAIRVPNERDNASTTKVAVQFPPGVLFLSYEPVPGWKAVVKYRKLAEPREVFGETITEEVDQVTWSGGEIAPGQFIEFPISWSTPARAGSTLTFKSVQAYSNGEVVRWIEAPDADLPAPQIKLTAKNAPIEDVPAGISAAASTPVPPVSDDDAGEGERDGLTLAFAIGGLAAGVAALGVALFWRPRRP